jgi:nucleoside-diphosphate-sugar epimerase
MKVLITGTEGYIGCLMAPALAACGHEVVGLDTGYFLDARLGSEPDAPLRVINKDLRHITRADLEGFDAVIHLAGLSNDAMGQISRQVTYDVNHFGSLRLASLAKEAGVSRFVYASSCSVYGRSHEEIVTETSRLDPQTDYALCKMLDEREIGALAGDGFSPTFLRNATAYGASPRMRFDLVVNNLAALAWTTKRLAMNSDGTPWRPIVHVLDICNAFRAVLDAPRDLIHDQIFNVGRTDENYQIRQIADCLATEFTGCDVSYGASDPDQRSYRVSFEKIARDLPDFRCHWDLWRGAAQLHELYDRVQLTTEMFRFRAFTRLAQLNHLIQTGQIDADFFWKGTKGDAPSATTRRRARGSEPRNAHPSRE